MRRAIHIYAAIVFAALVALAVAAGIKELL